MNCGYQKAMVFLNFFLDKMRLFIKSILIHLKNTIRKINRYRLRDYSQNRETLAVRNILGNQSSKVFVEIGSNDGITYSTTYGLLLDGWYGWSIEANPNTFMLLVRNLNRFKKVNVFNLAITPKYGKTKLWLGKNDPQGLLATISEEESDWYTTHRSTEYIDVDGVPLSLFLTQQNVPACFDLLIVDAEGMDFDILLTLDTNLHRPKLIITEDYEPKNAKKFALLESYGYRFYERIGCNTFWLSSK